MERFDAGIIVRITTMRIATLHFFRGLMLVTFKKMLQTELEWNEYIEETDRRFTQFSTILYEIYNALSGVKVWDRKIFHMNFLIIL